MFSTSSNGYSVLALMQNTMETIVVWLSCEVVHLAGSQGWLMVARGAGEGLHPSGIGGQQRSHPIY